MNLLDPGFTADEILLSLNRKWTFCHQVAQKHHKVAMGAKTAFRANHHAKVAREYRDLKRKYSDEISDFIDSLGLNISIS